MNNQVIFERINDEILPEDGQNSASFVVIVVGCGLHGYGIRRGLEHWQVSQRCD
jgi:hypothetical protein